MTVAKERVLTVRLLGDAKELQSALKKTEQSLGQLGPAGQGASRVLTGVQDGLNKLAQHSPAAQGAVTKINSALGSLGPTGTLAVGGLAVSGAAVVGFAAKGVQAFVDYTAQARAVQRVTGATAEDSS